MEDDQIREHFNKVIVVSEVLQLQVLRQLADATAMPLLVVSEQSC